MQDHPDISARDAVIADKIEAARQALTDALDEAYWAGLTVTLDVRAITQVGMPTGTWVIRADVSRPIRPKV